MHADVNLTFEEFALILCTNVISRCQYAMSISKNEVFLYLLARCYACVCELLT